MFILQRILKEREALPAGLINPTSGKLIWLVDEGAASQTLVEDAASAHTHVTKL